MQLEKFYDKIYSENEAAFGKGKPEEIVQNILKYRNTGTVLELGAGEGRNSVFLAENGFDVTARDISEVGIEKIKKQAEEKGLILHTETGDARALNPDKNFDIIVSTFMLHHFSREEALKFIKNIQERTNADGLNVLTAFTKNGDFFRNNPATNNFYPDKNELSELYAGWQIMEYEEVESKAFAKNPDGSSMFNSVARLIAGKKQK